MKKEQALQQMEPGQLVVHMGKNNFYPCLISHMKINSKWLIDLNVKHGTLKLLEENIGENLCNLGLVKDFLDKIPKA